MKRAHTRILLVVLPILLAGGFFSARWLVDRLLTPAAAQASAADPAQLRIGEAFLDHLDAGRYDAALAMTTPQVQQALAGGKLQEVWEALPRQLGERSRRDPLRGERVGDTPVVTSTLVFGMAALDARIAVEPDGLISGFRLVPAALPATSVASTAPADDAAFSDVDVRVGEGERALPGTLSLPRGQGPFPAVVLVHGSGPHDRDETIGPNTPFRDLAHGLAERGVAVLRYDKRTRARPEDFSSGDFTVDEEVTDDAVAAVAMLRAEARIDPARVFLAGHSLGAMMAPRIAVRAPQLAGLILLAAPARPLQDIIPAQLAYLAARDGEVSGEEQAGIDTARAQAAAVATLTGREAAADTLLGLPANYWVDLRAYDPVALAATLPQPMLVLQGGRDYQVTPEADFARWQADFDDVPRVRFGFYPALNHLFIPGLGDPDPREYALPGNVDPQVVEDIAGFVKAAMP